MNLPEQVERERMNRLAEYNQRRYPRNMKRSDDFWEYYFEKQRKDIMKIQAERREARRKAILSQKRFDNSQDIRSLEKFS